MPALSLPFLGWRLLRAATQPRSAQVASNASVAAWRSTSAFYSRTRPVCSTSSGASDSAGSGGSKPCLKELARQECKVVKVTGSKYEQRPVHQTLPAFVRKFVLEHPSAGMLLRQFHEVYMMVLQSPLPAEEEGKWPKAFAATKVVQSPLPAEECKAPKASDATEVLQSPLPAEEGKGPEASDAASCEPRTSRLLAALSPEQRAVAHLGRVGDADFYLMGFACMDVVDRDYYDPFWVQLLYVPPELRGQRLGSALLNKVEPEGNDGYTGHVQWAIPISLVHTVESWV